MKTISINRSRKLRTTSKKQLRKRDRVCYKLILSITKVICCHEVAGVCAGSCTPAPRSSGMTCACATWTPGGTWLGASSTGIGCGSMTVGIGSIVSASPKMQGFDRLGFWRSAFLEASTASRLYCPSSGVQVYGFRSYFTCAMRAI